MIALSKRRKKRSKRRRQTPRQSLRFTPYAWAKLLFLRDLGDTEVGMFGISNARDLLLVETVTMVKQVCTPTTVAFDDASVADYFDEQIDLGQTPETCGRIWLHTHPGSCPRPSGTDEETFERVFGAPDWGVMFIIAECGATYARLRMNVGPGANKRLSVGIDYDTDFPESDQSLWEAEYDASVTIHDPFTAWPSSSADDSFDWRNEISWSESEWVAS
jgi:hypothetical protein